MPKPKPAIAPTLRHTVVITGSEDLGSRKPCVYRLGVRSEKERLARAARWVGNPAATAAKRAEVLARLTYNPPAVPLKPKLIDETDTPTGVRRVYRLQINPDDETEAVLMLPHGATRKNKAPALLGLHEHGGMLPLGKEKLFAGMTSARSFQRYHRGCYGDELPGDFFARSGFAVLCIDQIGFGSRALWHDEDKKLRDYKNVSARTNLALRLRMRYEQFWLHRALLAYGVSEAEMAIHDGRRALDFLQSIPEVDGERIGAFGLSVGAMHCHFLAALDQRIRASVRVCWTGDLRAMIEADGPRGLGVHFLLPGANAELHTPEWVALAAPAPVLILNGKSDPLYPWKAQERARQMIAQYSKRESDKRRVAWEYFAGGHAFLAPQQQRALAFLRKHLT